MIIFLIKIFYFMLPAYFANMAPVIFKKRLNFLAIPIDFGKMINNKPLFGKTKTFRGLILGILSAILVCFIQFSLYRYPLFKEISIIEYEKENFILLGFLFGFGALFGDLIKSFFKRKLNKKPSESWKIIDQIDYVIGTLLFLSPIIILSFPKIFWILILSLGLTIIVNHIGWKLNFRKEKW